jgi:hypothetical protein
VERAGSLVRRKESKGTYEKRTDRVRGFPNGERRHGPDLGGMPRTCGVGRRCSGNLRAFDRGNYCSERRGGRRSSAIKRGWMGDKLEARHAIGGLKCADTSRGRAAWLGGVRYLGICLICADAVPPITVCLEDSVLVFPLKISASSLA